MPVVTLMTELDATQAFVMQYLVIYDWHSAALEKYKRSFSRRFSMASNAVSETFQPKHERRYRCQLFYLRDPIFSQMVLSASAVSWK